MIWFELYTLEHEQGFIHDFLLGGGKFFFVDAVSGTHSVLSGVYCAHATLGGSGGMLPTEI